MVNCKNVGAAQAEMYYRVDDYYTAGDPPARWYGKGAEALGLNDASARADFGDLLRGKLPNGQEIVGGGAGGKHRAGTDLTISAPKSVSIAALVAGDQRVLDAHHQAVKVALEKVEALIQARVTEKRQAHAVSTGNMIARVVEHYTSRAGDPNLHSHCVIVNATQRADGRWVAIENREVFRAQRELDQVYKAELACSLAMLGYSLRATKNGFELAQISDGQILEFSKRTAAIDAALESRGLSRESASADARETVALATRDRKVAYDQEQLRADWRLRGEALELNTAIPLRALDGVDVPRAEAAEKAVAFAIEHLSEREAAWSEDALTNAAQAVAWGGANRKDLALAVARAEVRGLVIRKLDGTFTTEAAQHREKMTLRIEARGRGVMEALTDDAERLRGQLELTKLNDRQCAAVEAVMTTPNRISAIQGLAGVGKTTLLDELRRHAEAAGYRLEGVAPSHSAVQALAEAGIEGKTLQSWEVSNSKLDERSLLVVDESSLVSSAQMHSVLKRAEAAGARVVLVGDSGQYMSVDAGRAFAQLQAAGMQTTTVDKMLRQQRDALREVAKLAAEGKGAEALMRLGDGVHEIGDRDERHAAIAARFAGLSADERKETLVLTGSNEDRRALNALIRENLGLAGRGVMVSAFQRGDLTVAQQKRAATYAIGAAVRFERDYKALGAARGEIWTVVARDLDRVTIAAADGRRQEFTPGTLSGKGLTVGSIEQRELTAGDRVRITGDVVSGASTLRNGQRATVVAVDRDRLIVQVDGHKKTVEVGVRQTLNLDHGYAATGHSAQGLGANRVLLERNSASLTASERQFYTDVTRVKQELEVYTDSRKRLSKSISRKVDKTQALDDEVKFERAHGFGKKQASEVEIADDLSSGDSLMPKVSEAVTDQVESILRKTVEQAVSDKLDVSRSLTDSVGARLGM